MINNSEKISTQNDISTVREAIPQIFAVTVNGLLLLAYGLTRGYTTILIPALSDSTVENSFLLDEESISWVSSINFISAPIGCIASGAFTQALGRRRALQITTVPFLAAWLLISYSTSVWHIYLAQIIGGLNGGLLEAPVLSYVAEVTQPHLRGALSTIGQLELIIGTIIQFVLGTFLHWRTLALINCAVPVLAMILLVFVPESPHWLIKKNRFDDARNALAWLIGWTTVEKIEPEFEELCRTLGKLPTDNAMWEEMKKDEEKSSMLGTLQNLVKRDFVKPFLLVSLVLFVLHFSGTYTIQTYAVQVFASLRTPIDKYYATMLLGATELLGCITGMLLLPRLGKRFLNFVCIVVYSTCFLTVATYAFMINAKYLELDSSTETTTDQVSNTWIPITFLVISAFVSLAGPRPLPWTLIGEVYSSEMRAFGSGLSSAVAHITGFISHKVFHRMTSTLTLPGTFWFYSAVGFLGVIALYFWLPETEGKSLHQINEHFSGKRKMDNTVCKRRRNVEQKPIDLEYLAGDRSCVSQL